MKKLISVLLAMVLCIGMLPASALASEEFTPAEEVFEAEPLSAEEIELVEEDQQKEVSDSGTLGEELTVEQVGESEISALDGASSGTCGKNLTWILTDNGVLTIAGSGAMSDEEYWNYPWYSFQDNIVKVVFECAVTNIGFGAFYRYANLKEVVIPTSVTSIAAAAFYANTSLSDIYYAGTAQAWSSIVIGNGNDSLTSASLHYDWSTAQPQSGSCGANVRWEYTDDGTLTISGNGAMDDYGYSFIYTRSGENLHWLPYTSSINRLIIGSGITQIGDCAFMGLYAMTSVTIPKSITKINPLAFSDCYNLKDVYYEGTEEQWQAITISPNNTYLQNATIHYLATGDDPAYTQEELKQMYIDQHSNYYYNGSYSDDIVAMSQREGLELLLEDMDNDLSDSVYAALKIASETTSITGMLSNVINNHDYPISFANEYSVIIFQLMANDDAYEGIQNGVKNVLNSNILSMTNKLYNNIEKLAKGDLSEDAVETARLKFADALEALESADIESGDYEAAWLEVGDLCQEYYDSKKTLEFFSTLESNSSDVNAILSNAISEFNTIGKAYQYMCIASTYFESSDLFRELLKEISDGAEIKAKLLRSSAPYNSNVPYSDAYQYESIHTAIEAWIERMDAYQLDANTELINEIAAGTAWNVGSILINTGVKWVTKNCLPGLGAINKLVSINKFTIDLFTTIDDEYKQAFMVSAIEKVTNVLIDITKDCGLNLIRGDMDARFSSALIFDEAVHIYETAMLLACDYGTKYEKLKLSSNVQVNGFAYGLMAPIINDIRQKQASLSSLIVSLLAFQKVYISDIHCHDDGLMYNNASGIITYETDNLFVVNIACPVIVIVTDTDGKRVAYLKDGVVEAADGLGQYFYISDSIDDSGSIKTVIIPSFDDYHLNIEGVDDGAMDITVARFDNNNIIALDTFADIPVTNSSDGYIDNSQDSVSGTIVVFGDEVYEASYEDSTIGDTNQDGVVDSYDAVLMLQNSVGIITSNEDCSFDWNSEINKGSYYASLILKYIE